MSIPGVQIPHCAPPHRTNAAWTGASSPSAQAPRPSRRLAHRPGPTATRQEQTASPSSRTVQAPQSPASQPTFVPVSPRSSRRAPRSAGGSAARSTVTDPAVDAERRHAISSETARRTSVSRDVASIRRRSRGRRRSAPGRRGPRPRSRRASDPATPAAPTSRASAASIRAGTSEQAPTTIRADATRPSGADVDHRGHARDRDDEVGARAELEERRPGARRRHRHERSRSTSSSGRRIVRRLPMTNSPTGTSRRPSADASSTRASSAIRFGSPSAAGEALQRLPAERPAVLDLDATDRARRGLQPVECRRQLCPDQVGPRREGRDPDDAVRRWRSREATATR